MFDSFGDACGNFYVINVSKGVTDMLWETFMVCRPKLGG